MRADRKVAHRVLNTLRYIHGNPKAAKMRSTFFYEFGNYGSYERLTDDGLTQWHPAFLQLGSSLEDCAKKYKGFCQRYKPKPKELRKSAWGSRLHDPPKSPLIRGTLNPVPPLSRGARGDRNPGCQVSESPEVTRVARQFIEANSAPWQLENGF